MLTEGKKGGNLPLEQCPETRDDKKERRPEKTPPREIWLKGTVVEEFLPIESLFFVSVVYMIV